MLSLYIVLNIASEFSPICVYPYPSYFLGGGPVWFRRGGRKKGSERRQSI